MFLKSWVEMGGFELNHQWHGINVLSLLECALIATAICLMLTLFFQIVKNKRRTILSLIGALSFATAAYAANTALSNLTASGALAGANLIYVVQTAGTGGVKATMTQVATFINSLFSGDATVNSGGVVTVTKINGQSPTVTTTCGTSGGGTIPVTLSASMTLRANTATTDTIANTDCGNVVSESNAASIAVTLPVATTTGFGAGAFFQVCNIGAGVATITPTTSTIGGASSKAIPGGTALNPSCLGFQSDGTNYNIVSLPTPAGLFTVTGALKGNGSGVVSQAACADLSNGATGCSTATGTSGATIPLNNGNNTISGNNTHSGSETFGEVIGSGRTVSGTTDTLAMTDCGTVVNYSNSGAVTVTIPVTLTSVCTIGILQIGAGKVSVNGTAVSAATLHSAVASGAAVGTRAQYSAIDLTIYTTGVAILTGDGA